MRRRIDYREVAVEESIDDLRNWDGSASCGN